jgi:hypothetical protein
MCPISLKGQKAKRHNYKLNSCPKYYISYKPGSGLHRLGYCTSVSKYGRYKSHPEPKWKLFGWATGGGLGQFLNLILFHIHFLHQYLAYNLPSPPNVELRSSSLAGGGMVQLLFLYPFHQPQLFSPYLPQPTHIHVLL